jgi:hypothetical protein
VRVGAAEQLDVAVCEPLSREHPLHAQDRVRQRDPIQTNWTLDPDVLTYSYSGSIAIAPISKQSSQPTAQQLLLVLLLMLAIVTVGGTGHLGAERPRDPFSFGTSDSERVASTKTPPDAE